MKKVMIKTMVSVMSLVLLSSTAMANPGNRLTDTAEAVSAALARFETNNEQVTIDLFKGVRAAPVSQGVAIKIYLTNGTKLNYSCHRHEDSEPFECH